MNAVDEVDYYEVVINGITTKYTTNTLKIETTSGSKTLTIKVYTKGGLYDQVTLRVRVK
jgi:RNase P/RNase MRP subunit p29